MSNVIDNRVVSMQFDNKHFEQNVQTSMSTIEKLKQSLNFNGTSRSLESVSAAAKGVNMSPLGSAVEAVRVKFSALEVMAVTALSNITNSAVNAGKRLVSALTIDPIKTGLAEYETQINAVQTILANTQSKGTTLDDVNAALDTLNKYADKTIYNFTEMTRNIGTFTAAGVDLDTSVNAIQGIANLAAISGSNAQQASTAMYQLSQALASGTVKLMDWNSVVNAGMGGQVFQDALKETARVHGIAIDDMIKKNGSFRETLQEGWLTSEILTETLMKFTMTTEGLTEEQIKQNRAMLAAQGYTEQQIDEIFALGEMATNAATKVKTFTQLLDTLKEAAQSGWTQTWELLIGDFEEAKSLWTTVSDVLGEIINKSAESRNKLLGGALESNWSRLVKKINEAGTSTEDFEKSVRDIATNHGYNIDKLVEQYGSLEAVFQNGKLPVDLLKEAITGLNSTMADFSKIERNLDFGDRGEDVKQLQQALLDLGYDLGEKGVDGYIGRYTSAAIKKFQEDNKLEVTGIVDEKTLAALTKATTKVVELDGGLDELIGGVDKLGGRQLLLEAFANIWKAIYGPIKRIGQAFREIFPPMTSEQLYKLIEGFKKFTDKLVPTKKQLLEIRRTFRGVFSVVKVFTDIIGGAFKKAFEIISKLFGSVDLDIWEFTAKIGDALVKFKDWIEDGDKITAFFDKIIGKVREWINAFLEFPGVKKAISAVKTELGKLGGSFGGRFGTFIEKFKEFFERFKNMDNFSLENIGKAFTDFKDNVLSTLWKNEDGTTIFTKLGDAIKNLWSKVKSFLAPTGEKFKDVGVKIGAFFQSIKDWIGRNMGAIIAIGSLIPLFLFVNELKDLIETFLHPFEGLEELAGALQNALNRISKALALKYKTEAVKSLAISIGILAAALVALTSVNQADLISATVCLGLIMGLMITLVAVFGNVSKNIADVKNAAQLGTLLLGLGASLILLAGALKIISDIDDPWTAFAIVAGFVGGIYLLAKGADKLVGGSAFDEFARMIAKISVSLLLLAVVVKIIGGIKTPVLIKGTLGIAAFLGIMAVVMRLSRGVNKDIPRFGSMMLGLSGALLSLSLVVAIFGKMETKTLVKGGLAVAAFMGVMALVIRATKGIGKDIPKFGGMMLGMSVGLLAMSAAVAVLGNMETSTLIRGGAAIVGMTVIMVAVLAATKTISHKHLANMGKIGLTMIGFASALLIMSVAVAALSFIKPEGLARALLAISALGVMFMGLLSVSRYAAKVKTGALVSMSIAIIVLAGTIVALTFIDAKKLAIAVGAMSAAMLSLAVLIASLSKAGKGFNIANILKMSLALLLVGTIIGGLVLAFGAIAINSLPGVGKKLSDFMDAISPFLDRISGIKPEILQGVKILAEVISALASASLKFTIADIFSGGGSTKAISAIKEWLKEIVPIVKDLAIDISKDDVNIDYKRLDAILGAVKTLAEAAASAPTAMGGGVMTTLGGGGFFSIPLLTEAKDWIVGVVPVVQTLAKEISAKGVTINETALTAVVDAAGKLAEAAAKAPSITVGAGGLGGKWGGGGAAVVTVPMLSAAADWISKVSYAIGDLATDVATNCKDLDTTVLGAIVDAAVALAEAASDAPTLDVGVGGFGSKWGGGGGAVVSVPMLSAAAKWMTSVQEPILELAGKVSDMPNLRPDNLRAITSSAKVLMEAMAEIPSAVGGLAGAGGAPGWGALALGASVPMISESAEWVTSISTPILNLAKEVSVGDRKVNKDNLDAICGSAKTLMEAMGAIPSKTWVAFGGGGVPGWGVGGGMATTPMINEAAAWVVSIKQPILDLAAAVTTGESKNLNKENLDAICGAAKTLMEAMGAIPSQTWSVFGAVSLLGIAGGFARTVPMINESIDWITAIRPKITLLAKSVSEGGNLENLNIKNLEAIVGAVKTLADASAQIPSQTDIKGGFLSWFGAGEFASTSKTQFTEMTEWVKGIAPEVQTLAEAVSGENYTINTDNLDAILGAITSLTQAAAAIPKSSWIGETFSGAPDYADFVAWLGTLVEPLKTFSTTIGEAEINTSAITAVAKAGKTLAEMAAVMPTEGGIFGWAKAETDWDTFNTNITKFGEAMVTFSTTVASIDTDAVSVASDAGLAIAEMIEILDYLAGYISEDAIFTLFESASKKLAQCMVDFSTTVSGINVDAVDTASSAALDITSILTKLKDYDYSSFSIDDFKASVNEIAAAIANFASNMEGVSVGHAAAEIENLLSMLSTLSNAKFTGAGSLQDTLSKLGKTSIDGFVKSFSGGTPKIIASVNALLARAVQAIKAHKTTLATAMKNTVDYASLSAYSSLAYSRAYSAGAAVVQGFARGISDNAWMAKKAAAAMAESAMEEAEEKLEINSPSKKFMAIGGSVPEGFAKGIDKFGYFVNDSVDTMADGALNRTRNVLARVADVVNFDIDSQPTIRPVLDLSAVSAGAKSIDSMLAMEPSIGVMSNIGTIDYMMKNNQNGTDSEVITAIRSLGQSISSMPSGDTYNINGVTYDDGSNIVGAVQTLVRAAKVERRK